MPILLPHPHPIRVDRGAHTNTGDRIWTHDLHPVCGFVHRFVLFSIDAFGQRDVESHPDPVSEQ